MIFSLPKVIILTESRILYFCIVRPMGSRVVKNVPLT